MTDHHKIYGLMAEFSEPNQLLNAARLTRSEGYNYLDAFSPYPVEGLSEAIGFKKDRVALIGLIGGVLSGASGFFMQWYADVIDYPINVGGRPDNSWPSFIPITFELTILGAALSTAIGMLASNKLPKPHHEVFNVKAFARVSKDRFFLCVNAKDPKFDVDKTRRFLFALEPLSVNEVVGEE